MIRELTDLIEAEGKRNNKLRQSMEEGKFPSEEVAREIGAENLFVIAGQTVEFNFRLNLEILKSNHYLTQLMKQYVIECENGDRVQDVDLAMMQRMIQEYTAETQNITDHLVNQQMRGYDAQW